MDREFHDDSPYPRQRVVGWTEQSSITGNQTPQNQMPKNHYPQNWTDSSLTEESQAGTVEDGQSRGP